MANMNNLLNNSSKKKSHYGVYSVDGKVVKEIYTYWGGANGCQQRVEGHKCLFKGGYSQSEIESYFDYMDKKTNGNPSNFKTTVFSSDNLQPFGPSKPIVSEPNFCTVTLKIPQNTAIQFAQILNAIGKAGQAADVILLMIDDFVKANQQHIPKPVPDASYCVDPNTGVKQDDSDPFFDEEDLPF